MVLLMLIVGGAISYVGFKGDDLFITILGGLIIGFAPVVHIEQNRLESEIPPVIETSINEGIK